MINVNLDLKIITSDLLLKEIYKYCVTKWCDENTHSTNSNSTM